MSAIGRSCLRLALVIAIVFIAGCASNTRARDQNSSLIPHWQGRLSVKVFTTPVQAFATAFELDGDGLAGTLSFLSPLGNTVARMQWDARGAQLQTTGDAQHFDSLDDLTRHATGAVLPVSSLFDWLSGRPTLAPGWEVDLHELPEGRLTAQRVSPETPVLLKVILDR